MSGCDSDRLEALLDGDGGGTAETRAHVAACARCAEELAWLRTERQLFTARAASPGVALPPFGAVLTQVRREGQARRSRWLSRAPWLGLAAAAFAGLAVLVTLVTLVEVTRPPAVSVAVAEPVADFTCYDEPRSLAVEATAYATDRAIASAEDQYGACLEATPAVMLGNARERFQTIVPGTGACAFSVESDVTCRPLRPLDDEVFASGICGGSLQ